MCNCCSPLTILENASLGELYIFTTYKMFGLDGKIATTFGFLSPTVKAISLCSNLLAVAVKYRMCTRGSGLLPSFQSIYVWKTVSPILNKTCQHLCIILLITIS